MVYRISILFMITLLTGCTTETSSESQRSSTITVSKVNQELNTGNFAFDSSYGLKCDGNEFSGCYVSMLCDRQSDTYSDKIVYGVSKNNIVAYVLYYDSSNCSGDFKVHPVSAGIWGYNVSSYQPNSKTSEISVDMKYYDDGFVFDPNKPQTGIIYKSFIWIDKASIPSRLCLSTGLIDGDRPLKFIDQIPAPLNEQQCAVGIS